MTHDEAIKALEEHNKWRRNEPPYSEGISAAMMPVKAKELGEVIEYAIEFMKRHSWQPIENAPKDGSTVCVYDGQWVFDAYFEQGSWYIPNNGDYSEGGYGRDYECGTERAEYNEPKLWFNIPNPPTEDVK